MDLLHWISEHPDVAFVGACTVGFWSAVIIGCIRGTK